MKCSKCGKEFGNGANCQYCGIDRVTGLGNFSGYNSPSGSYEPHYSSSNNGGYASNTMVCYACSEIIPKNSIYCPACGRQLWVECPNCGATYSTQYKICSKCGTNREVYYKQKEAEKQRSIREEQERQRKQEEWEQSPEGKAYFARRRTSIYIIKLLGAIVIIMGIVFFVLTISKQVSDNFENGKALEAYGLAIALIIMGGCFLFAEKMD